MAGRSADALGIGASFLGRYEVIEKVGEGGFGTVYKARQLTTDQFVAIKALRIPEDCPEDRLDRLAARFQREMRLCARLHHPNIVRLMDSGRTDKRSVYSVFEFVPGENLAAVLAKEQRLHPVEARHFMVQILDALACAHAQGVVHRDLKPANTMVVPTGARRNLVVLDFGIGALTEDARLDEADITRSNEWIGSPAYAAPEQLRSQRPLPRSDLYAWGLVFLECLTGERVIRGATAADAVFMQLSSAPIPIPERVAAHPLGQILRRVTQKDPAARDVTAEGLLRELEACDVSGLHLDGGSSNVLSPFTFERTVTLEPTENAGAREEALSRASAPAITGVSPVEGESQKISGVRPIEGERRQVTAVCCTLSMVSDGAGDIDFDEIDPIISAEQEACTAIARRFGGQIGGALSDTTLFLFGYPSSREDDARRAARAALAMVAEVRGRSATIASPHGARVELRVGVHTGLIVTRDLAASGGRMPSHLGGATPQMATKLSALAGPGEVLVSGETYRLLRGHFVLEGRGALAVAGAPIDVYRLHEGQSAVESRDVPLVGRQRELDALGQRWDSARGGTGQAVLITGEPGVGKSRLTRALRERLGAEAYTYLEGRCAQDATNSPLYPIVEMLTRLLDPRHDRSAEAKAEELEKLLSDHGFDLREAMPLFASLLSLPLPAPFSPLDVSPQKQREMTRDAVLSLLFEMGERSPVVLLVEDMHWADPSTLEVCAALVSEVASSRVYVLFTGRPEFSPPWSPSAALALQLGHLDRSDVGRMAAALSGGRSLQPEVIDRIAARTDGVPLFVEELVLMMLESGALAERDGAFVLTGTLDSLGIPSTLRGLLMARLDRLGRVKESAQVAAAIGREFDFDLLRAVLAAEEGALREDLEKLVAADLVHRKRRLRSATYVFKHALVQDTAYDSILKGQRREIHERIGRALERDFPQVVEEQPEVLARHFERAGLTREATTYLVRAGQRAMQRSAFIEVTALLSHGIELVVRAPEEEWTLQRELELRLILGGALTSSKGHSSPEFEANALRARELSGKLGSLREQFLVTHTLWLLYVVGGNRDAAESCSLELITIAEKHKAPNTLLSAYQARGVTTYFSQRCDEADEWLRRSLQYYDPKNHLDLIRTYGEDHGFFAHVYLQLTELFRGNIGEALRWVERTRELTEELRDPLASAIAAVYNVMGYYVLGDDAQMEANIEVALKLTVKHGFYYWEMFSRIARGLLLVRRGDVDAGMEQLRVGLSQLERNNQWTARPYWTLYMVDALFSAGRFPEALRLIESTVAGAVGKLDQWSVPLLLRIKGAILAVNGDRDGAMEIYRQALAMAMEQGDHASALKISLSFARGLLEADQREEARAHLSTALSKIHGGEGWSEHDEGVELLATLS